MNEMGAILEAWRENRHAGGVLATVVHVEGSAYRRPGARMLIGADGTRVGSISGGCLEGDVAKKAVWWTARGAVLRVYDTTSDDDAVWEFGLGCNGVIHVLLEPADSAGIAEMMDFISAHRAAREGCSIATVIRGEAVGSRLLWDSGGVRGGNLAPDGPVLLALRATMSEKQSRLLRTGDAELFVEWVAPPQNLVIFGAGHDAIPVALAARALGWSVTVADGRPAYAKASRFPGCERVMVIPPSADVSQIPIYADTAVVMMTHNYPQDRRLLPQILERQPFYLGLLGPKRRAERLFGDIGLLLSDYDVHAPIGLDIGSEEAETIAIAVIAEIQAVLTGRRGGHLRWRRGPIHAPVTECGDRIAAPAEAEIALISSCGITAGSHA